MRRGRILVFLAVFITWVFPAALFAFAFCILFSPPFHTFYAMAPFQVRFGLTGLFGLDFWQVGADALHDVWRSSAFIGKRDALCVQVLDFMADHPLLLPAAGLPPCTGPT